MGGACVWGGVKEWGEQAWKPAPRVVGVVLFAWFTSKDVTVWRLVPQS